MLKISHVSKKYGDKEALNDVSLEVHRGEIYGFIGHNGAGKTTLIKAICGIHEFDTGTIEILDHNLVKEPIECKKQMHYISDNPELYENLTGIQYLNFIADIFEMDEQTRLQKIQQYGDEYEMTSSLGDAIASYSHGMKQKLAIISACIHEPQLMILDEPFVGLDPKATHTLKEYMKKRCKEGASFFFSTHVLEVAEKLCDRISMIRQGEIVCEGVMEEVLQDSTLEEVFLEYNHHE